MKPANSQRYLLADDFDERSKDLSMRRSAWSIISSISQLRLESSFRDFCADLSLSENEANSVIAELLENRLIHENCATDVESAPSRRPVVELLSGTFSTLAIGIFGDRDGSDPIGGKSDSTTEIKMRLGGFPEAKKPPHMIRSWIWKSPDKSDRSSEDTLNVQILRTDIPKSSNSRVKENKSAISSTHSSHKNNSSKKAEVRKYKLQPIISQIEKLSAGGVEGSVLVYQVFLKVSPELLKNEGIESLKLVDANTEFTSQELCQAIIRATTQITGFSLKIIGYNQ